MASQVRNPTSDVSFTGTWTETATTRWTFVDDFPSQDSANILTHGTATPGEGLLGFSAFTVPAGSLNIVVWVDIYAYKNSGAGNSFATRIRAGSTPANADGSAITTLGNGVGAIALFSQSFPLNPKTSAAWTVADVNGAATNGLNAFGIVATDANPSISITSIQLRVEYDPAILPVPVADAVALSETCTAMILVQPQGLSDTLTLADTAAALRWEAEWYGDIDLFIQPQMADLISVTDHRTVIIPVEDVAQISTADQIILSEDVLVQLTPYSLAVAEQVVLSEAFTVQSLLTPLVDETLALSDAGTAVTGHWEWYGAITMSAAYWSIAAGELLTLTDVQTVGNDRYAEIAWIEMEVPASATEIDVPFGQILSGLIQVQLKYKGSSNRIRAIIATNLTSQESTFIVNDNGTEHAITIPSGITAQELELDEEVTLGAGVSCNVKTMKGEPQ